MTARKKYFSKCAILLNAAIKQMNFRRLSRNHHQPNLTTRTVHVMFEIMEYTSIGAAVYAGWAYDNRQ